MVDSLISDDDIREVYSSLDNETKLTVSAILRDDSEFVSAYLSDSSSEGSPMMRIQWKSSQSVSVALLCGLIRVGEGRFGSVWLDWLKNQVLQ